MGVVIMHELISHGHPAGGGKNAAHNLNFYYQIKLGYTREPYGNPHDGYHTIIGWKKTNLYNKK
jgi:hypothetical protein